MIRASAPTRLDFGGGWTDVPPFPEERGGFVCNLAVERRATVTLTTAAPDAPPPDALTAAALRHAARHRPSLDGLTAHNHSDFPTGAGLGGSSAAGVATAAAIAAHTGEALTPAQLAERSRTVEVDELGVAGGRQDHYAAAFGGALGLAFTSTTTVDKIDLNSDTIRSLESQITVIYSGESRISGETITAVLDAYASRVPRVVQALDRMAALARQMHRALGHGNLAELAALVDEHWHHQRSLHPAITTDRIDAIEAAVRAAGATGFKALGASGGGCVIALSPDEQTMRVRSAAAPLGTVLTWSVAREGVRLST
jgi:D-glycero-alpha-D-manno-heptose-7-phosphate kinase